LATKEQQQGIRDRKTVRSETLAILLEKEKGRGGNPFLSRTYYISQLLLKTFYICDLIS